MILTPALILWLSASAGAEYIAAGPSLSIMSLERRTELARRLPAVEERWVARLLREPHLLFYTDKEMPRCYQDWDGSLRGVFAADYNISAASDERFGNGNQEFPWGSPGGTHRAPGVESFRFLRLPLDSRGRMLPVVWYRKKFSRDAEPGYGWMYPIGAVLGEVLMLRDPEGRPVTFELRLRIREADSWGVDVLRPFPQSTDLAARIRELAPRWREDERLSQLVARLEAKTEFVRHRLEAGHPDATSFQSWMGIDVLDAIDDPALVSQLLATPFQSCLGVTWKRGTNGIHVAAPTTQSEYHIVPRGYDAGFIEVDRQSCLRCHDAVNRHVRDFAFVRDWYGRIRGSDGIFSFHPFSLDSISRDGYGRPITIRRELLDAGVVAPHDPSRHLRTEYSPIPELQGDVAARPSASGE